MKYATLINGKVNLIVCDKDFATEHPDIVIEVPDHVYTGWIKKDNEYFAPQATEATVPRDSFLDRLTNKEMVAIYSLAEIDIQAAVFKDLILAKDNLNRKKLSAGLDYFVDKKIFTKERKAELI